MKALLHCKICYLLKLTDKMFKELKASESALKNLKLLMKPTSYFENSTIQLQKQQR